MTTKSHTYKGQHIYPCERVPGEHRGRWTVQTYHRASEIGGDRMPYADELCPHYSTLAAARESIREAQATGEAAS